MTGSLKPEAPSPQSLVIPVGQGKKANALSRDVVEHVATALRSALTKGSRMVLFVGASPDGSPGTPAEVFSAGFDFTAIESQGHDSLVTRFTRIQSLLQQIRTAPAITAAYVSGPAVGAGADLALACDYVYADSSARFRFPGFRFGVALGTDRLVQLAGARRAMEWALTQRWVGSAEALSARVVYRICDWADFQRDMARLADGMSTMTDADIRRLITLVRGAAPESAPGILLDCLSDAGLPARMNEYWTSAASTDRGSILAFRPFPMAGNI